MTEDSEWPKSWARIKSENTGAGISSFKRDWVEFSGGMRGYKDTLYVSESVGRESRGNNDAWMPFEVYIEMKMEEL